MHGPDLIEHSSGLFNSAPSNQNSNCELAQVPLQAPRSVVESYNSEFIQERLNHSEPMRQFLKPTWKRIALAVMISFLSLFLFDVLFGFPIIGFEWYGGYIEEENAYWDAIGINIPYTVSNILGHLTAGYLFVCFLVWGSKRIRGMEHRASN